MNSTADRAISLADNLSGNSLSHLTSATYIPHSCCNSPQGIQIERKLRTGEQSQHNFRLRCEKAKCFHYNGFHFSLPRPLCTPPLGTSDNKVNSAYSSSAMAIVFALLLGITTVPPTSMQPASVYTPLPLEALQFVSNCSQS